MSFATISPLDLPPLLVVLSFAQFLWAIYGWSRAFRCWMGGKKVDAALFILAVGLSDLLDSVIRQRDFGKVFACIEVAAAVAYLLKNQKPPRPKRRVHRFEFS